MWMEKPAISPMASQRFSPKVGWAKTRSLNSSHLKGLDLSENPGCRHAQPGGHWCSGKKTAGKDQGRTSQCKINKFHQLNLKSKPKSGSFLFIFFLNVGGQIGHLIDLFQLQIKNLCFSPLTFHVQFRIQNHGQWCSRVTPDESLDASRNLIG